MPLTARQARFVEAYDGNGTRACEVAGYAGDKPTLATQANRLLKNAEIVAAIRLREGRAIQPSIASRQDRQSFWTSVMKDENQEMRDRLKAAELLGKSEADFTEKLQHSGAITLEQLVAASVAKPDNEGKNG